MSQEDMQRQKEIRELQDALYYDMINFIKVVRLGPLYPGELRKADDLLERVLEIRRMVNS
jgi:hypothetical protein